MNNFTRQIKELKALTQKGGFIGWLARWMLDNNVIEAKTLGRMVGVEGSTVGHWLSGRIVPRPDNVKSLAKVTKVREDKLFILVYNIDTPEENLPPELAALNELLRDEPVEVIRTVRDHALAQLPELRQKASVDGDGSTRSDETAPAAPGQTVMALFGAGAAR